MQNAQHIAGPWKIATTYAGAQKGKFDIVPWDSQQFRICRIAARADYSVAHTAATAQLIAAAPDLLAALAGCADALREAGKGFALNNPNAARPNLYELHEQAARAAIAKATA